MSMLRTALTTSARSAIASSSRTFHASAISQKSATEKVAEVADKLNKSVGKGLADAIEKGEKATEVTKETLGVGKKKAAETSEAARQKANQAAAEVKEGTRDFKHNVEKELRK
ncbi:hypothetical protein LXA43DRAFT_250713 [Ganoderma leucocontextum]|nr:hypothetical protein LXA43DRAFT_250713 [Ganoderma leucocontextum]